MAKKPRFFCENCGAEVGRQAKSCPECGRYFSSVRCPRCNYTAAAMAFNNGCPQCGYSEIPEAGYHTAEHKNDRALPPLPLWIWLTAILALALAMAAMIRILIK